MKDILEKGLTLANITWNNKTIEAFIQYKGLLIEWNEKFNLTSIIDEKDIAVKHFLDSVSIWDAVKDRKNLADIGSGAGFPGIPLKIIGFTGDVFLMDSSRKRVGFLNEVINALKLKNCHAVHIRAEDAGRGEYRERFDVVTARAVAGLPVLCEYCLPLVKKGGVFIAMKGKEGKNEAKKASSAISKLGGKITEIKESKLYDTEYNRTLVYIEKITKTPPIYPRKAGTPGKRPL